MAGEEALIQAILGQRQQIAQRDPFSLAGQQVLQVPTYQEGGNPWANIATSFTKGLVGGGLSSFGKSRTEDAFQGLLQDYATAQESPGGMLELATKRPELAPTIGSILAKSRASQRASASKLDDLLQEKQIEAAFDALGSGKSNARDIAESILSVRRTPTAQGGFQLGLGPSKQTIDEENAPQATFTQTGGGVGGKGGAFQFNSPVEPVNEQFTQEFQRLVDAGVTPSQAAQTARSLLKGDIDAFNKTFDTTLEAREKARKFRNLADMAQEAVQDAGSTGGPLGGLRQAASGVLGLVDEGQREKFAASNTLDSLKANVLAETRVKGSGQTSDFEARAYLQGGPSTINTPETNTDIINRMRNLANLESDYADFLETYKRDFGTVEGAEAVWQRYLGAHPNFVQFTDEAGKQRVELNQNRPNWKQFFAGQSTPQQQATASGPIATEKPIPQAPRPQPQQLAPQQQGPDLSQHG